jgi:hypothetical protein
MEKSFPRYWFSSLVLHVSFLPNESPFALSVNPLRETAMRRFRKNQHDCPQACKNEVLAVRPVPFDHLLASRVGGEIYCTVCLRGRKLLNKTAFEQYRTDDVRPFSYYSLGDQVVYQGIGHPNLQGKVARIVTLTPDRLAEIESSSGIWAGTMEIEFQPEARFGASGVQRMVVKSYDLRVYKGLSVEAHQLLDKLTQLNQFAAKQAKARD